MQLDDSRATPNDAMALTDKQKKMLKYAAIGAAAWFLVANKKGVSDVASSAATYVSDTAFKAVLPSGVALYAEEINRAAAQYDVSRWILAAIMQSESNGGMTLRPKGPSGSGDFIKRPSDGRYAPFMDPYTGLPRDGHGWGRGLMQIDYGAHNAWVISNAWWDPQTNINKAAEIYSEGRRQLANAGVSEPILTPASLAAYNTGVANVLRSIRAGKDPSATTTGADYAQKVLGRVAQWTDAAQRYV